MAIALDFFADPTSEADQSCIADSTEPVWVPASLADADFEPYQDDVFGIAGVVPAGWDDQGFGIRIRTETNIAHQSIIFQQGGPVPAEQFTGLIAAQFGATPTPADDIVVGDRTWAVSDVESPFGSVRAYTHEVDGFTFFVAALGPPSDVEEMTEFIIPTLLEEIDQL